MRAYRRFIAAGGNALLFHEFEGLDGTLVDLGGYQGDWTAEMLAQNPQTRVFVFEPVPAYAHELRKRFAADERVIIHDVGLGAATRPETIRVAGDSSSIYRVEPDEPGVPVRIVDVVEWWEASAVDAVALLKVNIEGGEFEVLPRLIETGLIERVEHIQVQFHRLVPSASRRMRAILRDLRRTHKPVWRYPFVWESWRRKPY